MAKSALEFDPHLVAHLEAAGWRAYYERNWRQMLGILIKMCRTQFKMPLPMALLGAYYATRAAIAWVPTDHNLQTVHNYYTKFYRLARKYCGLNFEPEQIARLEIEYSQVHRRLSGQPDKHEFIEVMTALHAAVFALPPERTRLSAEWRVKANNTVDLITSHQSDDPATDWVRLEKYLQLCYQSIQTELDKEAILAS